MPILLPILFIVLFQLIISEGNNIGLFLLHHIMSRLVTLQWVTSCCIKSCYVLSSFVMFSYI